MASLGWVDVPLAVLTHLLRRDGGVVVTPAAANVRGDGSDLFVAEERSESGHVGAALHDLAQHVVGIAHRGVAGELRAAHAAAAGGAVARRAELSEDLLAGADEAGYLFLAQLGAAAAGRRRPDGLTGDGHEVPDAAEALAQAQVGVEVTRVAVKRPAVVGHLLGTVVPGNGADQRGVDVAGYRRLAFHQEGLPVRRAVAGTGAGALGVVQRHVQRAAVLVREDRRTVRGVLHREQARSQRHRYERDDRESDDPEAKRGE